METEIFQKAFEVDPMWGLVVGLLLFGSVTIATGLAIAVRVLWKKNTSQEERERSSLERTLILLDKVGDGLKAAERDRELRATDRTERILFEAEMRQAFKELSELRSTITRVVEQRR